MAYAVDDLFGSESLLGDPNDLDNLVEFRDAENNSDADERPGDGEVDNDEDNNANKDNAVKAEDKKIVRVKRPQPKLDADRLKGPRGLRELKKTFTDVKFNGKGHEAEDLHRVMARLEHWAHRLFPKLQFDDFIEKVEKLGSKKVVQNYVRRLRMGLEDDDDDVIRERESNKENDLVDPDDPDPIANDSMAEFDRLLAEQVSLHDNSRLAATLPRTPAAPSRTVQAVSSTPVPALTPEQRARIEANRLAAMERRRTRAAVRATSGPAGAEQPAAPGQGDAPAAATAAGAPVSPPIRARLRTRRPSMSPGFSPSRYLDDDDDDDDIMMLVMEPKEKKGAAVEAEQAADVAPTMAEAVQGMMLLQEVTDCKQAADVESAVEEKAADPEATVEEKAADPEATVEEKAADPEVAKEEAAVQEVASSQPETLAEMLEAEDLVELPPDIADIAVSPMGMAAAPPARGKPANMRERLAMDMPGLGDDMEDPAPNAVALLAADDNLASAIFDSVNADKPESLAQAEDPQEMAAPSAPDPMKYDLCLSESSSASSEVQVIINSQLEEQAPGFAGAEGEPSDKRAAPAGEEPPKKLRANPPSPSDDTSWELAAFLRQDKPGGDDEDGFQIIR